MPLQKVALVGRSVIETNRNRMSAFNQLGPTSTADNDSVTYHRIRVRPERCGPYRRVLLEWTTRPAGI